MDWLIFIKKNYFDCFAIGKKNLLVVQYEWRKCENKKRKKIKKENPKRRTEDGKKSRACFDLFKVLK